MSNNKNKIFEDKIAIITGGTGALGRVIVNLLSETGMKIYVPTKSIEKFRSIFDNSTSNSLDEFKLRRIYGLQCDAEKEVDVINFINDVIKRETRIDFLINTVGGYHPKKNLNELDTVLISKMMSLNFYTTFYFCKYVLDHMIKNNYGRIIAIGAKPAVELSNGKFAYSISKLNIINLIQTIALECKASDITANVIIPSIIDTPGNRKSMPNSDFSKWVSPIEIAETIHFLFTDEAKSVNGNIIKMYGGV